MTLFALILYLFDYPMKRLRSSHLSFYQKWGVWLKVKIVLRLPFLSWPIIYSSFNGQKDIEENPSSGQLSCDKMRVSFCSRSTYGGIEATVPSRRRHRRKSASLCRWACNSRDTCKSLRRRASCAPPPDERIRVRWPQVDRSRHLKRNQRWENPISRRDSKFWVSNLGVVFVSQLGKTFQTFSFQFGNLRWIIQELLSTGRWRNKLAVRNLIL